MTTLRALPGGASSAGTDAGALLEIADLEVSYRINGHWVRVVRSASLTVSRNEVVGLLCERDIVGNGELLEFFGHPARVPLGPAVLSLRSGAPLLPNAVFGTSGLRAFGKILAPLEQPRSGNGLRADAIALTNQLLRCFEALIREHPEQWHVFQPYWEDERPTTVTSVEPATSPPPAGT